VKEKAVRTEEEKEKRQTKRLHGKKESRWKRRRKRQGERIEKYMM